jgi:hypothetical protein
VRGLMTFRQRRPAENTEPPIEPRPDMYGAIHDIGISVVYEPQGRPPTG